MTKSLNSISTKSISFNSALHGLIDAAATLARGVLPSFNSNDSTQLSNRLRYDSGALDLNPDCQPRSAAARQNMDHLRSI